MGGGMSMTFFAGTNTALFSQRFSAENLGEYVGICMFLILLALVLRFLLSFKAFQEYKWKLADADRNLSSFLPTVDGINKTESASSINGRRSPKMVRNAWRNAHPWRWSTDLPRAALSTLISGLGYLLMLAVMTMNVGFVLSVLGGVFLGELIWGRFISGGGH